MGCVRLRFANRDVSAERSNLEERPASRDAPFGDLGRPSCFLRLAGDPEREIGPDPAAGGVVDQGAHGERQPVRQEDGDVSLPGLQIGVGEGAGGLREIDQDVPRRGDRVNRAAHTHP